MYAYIKGEVINILNNKLIIENNKIGYEINCSENSLLNMTVGEEIKVYTYYYVTQDSISLFGFSTLEEKSMFEKLISVSGIGAKTAIRCFI